MAKRCEDLTGRRFGRLTVASFSHKGGRRKIYWNCVCDCGNESIVEASHLKSGHTKSCGCYGRELASAVNKKTGQSGTPLYRTYWNMLHRCYWEKQAMYSHYGGRGIKVCDEWLGKDGFENFMNWSYSHGYDGGASRKKCTLDRIDNNGNYEPCNCRWVNEYIQANNKRNNRFVKINGEIGTVANMARKYNVDYWNLMRYSKGGKNCQYENLTIEVVTDGEIQEYRASESNRSEEQRAVACPKPDA